MHGVLYSVSILLSLAPLHGSAKTCFAPDGSVADPTYQPCIAIDGIESMCCSLNTTHPDTCQPNGLCLSNSDGKYGSNYWRDFCTDKTWESPNCLSKTVCDKNAGGSSSWTYRLVLCKDGAYCCGTDRSCCLEGTTFKLASTLVQFGNSSVARATATATITSKISGSSNVAIGAGVGIPLGVLALAALGADFVWGRRKTQARYEALGHTLDFPTDSNGNRDAQIRSGIRQADSAQIHEVSGVGAPSELPGSKTPAR